MLLTINAAATTLLSNILYPNGRINAKYRHFIYEIDLSMVYYYFGIDRLCYESTHAYILARSSCWCIIHIH